MKELLQSLSEDIAANKEHTIQIHTKGREGSNSIVNFINGIKDKTYVLIDEGMYEYERAFYFSKGKFFAEEHVTDDEGTFTVTSSNRQGLMTLVEMLSYIQITGGGGHSFPISDSNGQSTGWDGDGDDRITKILVGGTTIDPYWLDKQSTYKFRDKIFKAMRK